MNVVSLQVGATTVVTGSIADVRAKQDFARKGSDVVPIVIRTSAGASVSIQVEASIDGTNFVPVGSAFTTVNSGTVVNAPRVPFLRANITAISGVTVNAHAVV